MKDKQIDFAIRLQFLILYNLGVSSTLIFLNAR